ncbi:hypothetical protein N657DRAFT_419975 [Parathielavia appendiculata]|uniref:Uncharacterized protein n=1 Tax=Parathielavia appendiculata TaxID=2587402 RepID=A0AAN6TZM5_9PEZI|nr:hypothetical protein N657DRAFT_419975 [Parathielavia appendiculata]
MDARHEIEIDNMCNSTSEVDTCWKLFRLLSPGMDGTEESVMKILTVLSLLHRSRSIIDYPKSKRHGHSFLTQELSTTTRMICLGCLSHATISRLVELPIATLSGPVFESTQQVPQPLVGTTTPTRSHTSLRDSSGAPPCSWSRSQSASNGGATSTTSIQPGSPSIEKTHSHIGTSSVAHLQRNNERLRQRNQQAASKISELRNANRASETDIRDADGILERVLNSGDLSVDMYESLNQLSRLLQAASEKLRSVESVRFAPESASPSNVPDIAHAASAL